MAKTFVRHAIHRKKKLAPVWRKPKGLQNKLRLNHRGHKKQISTGFGAPKESKGKIKGKTPILIKTHADLANVKAGCIAILSAKMGERKRVEILNICKEKKLEVLNVKNVDDYLKKIADGISKNKEKSTTVKKTREERQKELESKAAKEKKDIESKVEEESEEGKKKKEKAEKDKVLTSKDN